MERPSKRRLLKIAIIFIIVSVVLFSVSIYLIDSNFVTKNGVSINSGSSYVFPKGHVNAGDDIDYTVTSKSGNMNVSVYFLYDTGASSGYANATSQLSLSNVIVSKYSGNFSLVIVNQGNSPLTVDLSIGTIGYLTIVSTVFGFVLLPSGIVLLAVNAYSRFVNRRREKLIEEFE